MLGLVIQNRGHDLVLAIYKFTYGSTRMVGSGSHSDTLVVRTGVEPNGWKAQVGPEEVAKSALVGIGRSLWTS